MQSRRVSKILRLFDEAASPWFRAFPDFFMPGWLVASRLSCYADGKQWCLLIEVAQVDPSAPGHLGIATVLYPVSDPPGEIRPLSDRNFLYLMADAGTAPTFMKGKNGTEYVNPHVSQFLIRGLPIPIPSVAECAHQDVGMRSGRRLMKHKLARCLAGVHRGIFFATESEIHDRIGPGWGVPILRLDTWRHPKISNGELPSATKTFQMLAQVLATGDRTAYKQIEEPNNDWRNWPDCEDV